MPGKGKKAPAKTKTVTSRKKLWIARDAKENSDVEIYRNKPTRSETAVYDWTNDCHMPGYTEAYGSEFQMCAAGFEKATGLKIKPDTCAELSISITRTQAGK